MRVMHEEHHGPRNATQLLAVLAVVTSCRAHDEHYYFSEPEIGKIAHDSRSNSL